MRSNQPRFPHTTGPRTAASVTRRVVLLQLAASGGAAWAAAPVPAATPTAVNEADASAVNLGYVSENSRADRKRFPRFTPEQKCGNCSLYQAKGGASTGPCPIFGGKLVAAGGWCSGWSKKA